MPNVIRQTVRFDASPRELYALFMNGKKHTAATGYKATVSPRVGGRFTAFDGMLRGRTLCLYPNRLIVQAWRSSHWPATNLDSILTVRFDAEKSGTRITLVHANVPDHDLLGVRKGWRKYYWIPWRAYLRKRHRR